MLAAGQKPLFDMLAQLVNTPTGTQCGARCKQLTYPKHSRCRNFLERALVQLLMFSLLYYFVQPVLLLFDPKTTLLQN